MGVVEGVGNLFDRRLLGASATTVLSDLERGSSLACPLAELRNRSVIVAPKDQLAAALALIELDGIARRLVVAPPDLPLEQMATTIIDAAEIDAVVSDREPPIADRRWSERLIGCGHRLTPHVAKRNPSNKTEWILFTSGTTGLPKMVRHSFASLAGAIEIGSGALEAARFGALSMTFAATAACRFSCARSWWGFAGTVERPGIDGRLPGAGRAAG